MTPPLKIVVERHSDGYVAYPLALARAVILGQGDTYEDALADVRSAIEFHQENLRHRMNPSSTPLFVEARIDAPIAKVWTHWVTPEHIREWNFAHESWHCPAASHDLQVGGAFNYRMEARDGSMGFDYAGTYTAVEPHTLIAYRLGEGPESREAQVAFESAGDATIVRETFDPDPTRPIEMQRGGWQAILARFKAQTENANS